MERIAVDEEFDATADRVRSILADETGFFEAAGFDAVRDADRLTLKKIVAMAHVTLAVKLREDDDSAALSYEQVSGPFEAMEARYVVESVADGSRLTIETSFEPSTSGLGTFLNGAAVRRQRRRELGTIESLLESGVSPSNSGNDSRGVSAGGD